MKLSQELRESILQAVKSGKTVKQIKSEFEVGSATVFLICKPHGLYPRGSISLKDRAERQQNVLTAIRSGAKIEETASKFKLSPRTVWSICQKNGVPTAGQWLSRKAHRSPSMSLDDFIKWVKTQCTVNEKGCMIWGGFVNKKGYPRARFNGRLYYVQRLVCQQKYNRELLPGECGLHRCDTPSCLNPDHLWLGTNKDNVDDRESKGRNVVKFGEEHGLSILKTKDVVEIKKALAAAPTNRSPITRVLAEKYGVSRSLIQYIRAGKLWKHVKLEENVDG